MTIRHALATKRVVIKSLIMTIRHALATKRVVIKSLIIILMLSVAVFAQAYFTEAEGVILDEDIQETKTIYVDDNFIDDPVNNKWNTIQEGINDANKGNIVIVKD